MRQFNGILTKLRKSQALLWVLLALLLFISLTILWLARGNKRDYVSQQLVFHPDAVTQLDWGVGRKVWKFARENRNRSWEPAMEPHRIQRKLLVLATLPLKKMVVPSHPEIEIRVEFAEKNYWTGVYKNSRFVWTSGNFAGLGADLSETTAEVFLEGRYAFEPLKWSWCDAHPNEMQFRQDDVRWTLSLQKSRWILANADQSPAPIDGSAIERWLGAHCEVNLRAYRDLKMEGLGRRDGALKIVFQNGRKSELHFHENWLEISREKAGLSEDFLPALKSLKDVK